MKQLLPWLIAYCLLPIALFAQNLTTVTASSLYKGGALLPIGQICFTGTDSNDNPIPFRVGGGGQEVTYPYCATVTNGAIVGTFQVANPANTAPANINYRVELFDQYNRLQKWAGVQFTGATFNFDNYVPSANLPLGTSANTATIGNLTVTGSCTGCGGGSGGGYSTIQNAGSALAQRATANFFSGIICADNSGQSRTDCQIDQTFSPTWSGAHTFSGTTNIAGTFQISGAAPQGKIPIGNGTSYVPGDPLVQGVQAAGSTTAVNPVSVGGFDTSGTPVLRNESVLNSTPAGTEYGFVTRNIPSGTQTVSVSNTPAVSSSQLPSALDGSGYLKVHEQGTATVSGTVTANQGGTWTVQPGNTANTTPWLATVNQGGNSATVTAANALKVDGSGVTQPVSGTVSVNALPTGSNTIGKVDLLGNSGVTVDAAIGATAPANVVQEGLKDTSGNSQAALSDTNGRQILKTYPDTTTTSYHASSKFAASSTTDNFVVPGNATNKVLVTKIQLTCTQTTAGQVNVELLKRSTADTSGTSSNVTAVPDYSSYAAALSVPKSYTGTGPTVGAAVGDLDNAQIGCMASSTATPNDVYIFKPLKPIILNGTAEQIAISLGGALTGGTITVTVDWMETTTP